MIGHVMDLIKSVPTKPHEFIGRSFGRGLDPGVASDDLLLGGKAWSGEVGPQECGLEGCISHPGLSFLSLLSGHHDVRSSSPGDPFTMPLLLHLSHRNMD